MKEGKTMDAIIWYLDSSLNYRQAAVCPNIPTVIQQRMKEVMDNFNSDKVKATTMDCQLIDMLMR